MIILGIILLICAAIAVLLQDILALWVCVILGIYCIGSGLRKRKRQQQQQVLKQFADISKKVEPTPPSVPITPKEKPPTQEQKPLGKCVKSITFKVAGVTFECEYGPFDTRQKALEISTDSDTLILEPYKYKGQPAFYIINKSLSSDIGVVPATYTEQINELYGKYDLVGKFTELDSFCDDSEDEDYDSDYEPDLVYYAKVQFKAYEKSS